MFILHLSNTFKKMSKLNLLQSETLKKYLFCLIHYLLFFQPCPIKLIKTDFTSVSIRHKTLQQVRSCLCGQLKYPSFENFSYKSLKTASNCLSQNHKVGLRIRLTKGRCSFALKVNRDFTEGRLGARMINSPFGQCHRILLFSSFLCSYFVGRVASS